MTTKPKRVLSVATVLIVALVLPATMTTGAPPPDRLSESLADFEFMLGTWTVREVFAPGPMGEGGEGKGEMVASPGPGGQSIVLDYRSVDGPMAGFSMHEIIVFDESKNAFEQAYVTNRSAGLTVAQGIADENGFVFERRFERKGQTFTSRGTIQEISEDSFAMESHMGPAGGKSRLVMRLELSKP